MLPSELLRPIKLPSGCDAMIYPRKHYDIKPSHLLHQFVDTTYQALKGHVYQQPC